MLEENRNIGIAVSLNGITWKKLSTEGIFKSKTEWNSQVVCDPKPIPLGDGMYKVYYGGGDIASLDEGLNGQICAFILSLDKSSIVNEFKASDNWDNLVNDSKEILLGSYSIENPKTEEAFVWMKPNGTIYLNNENQKNKVNIQGYLLYDMYSESDIDCLTMKVYINGILEDIEEFTENQEINISIDKTKYGDSDRLKIEIDMSNSISNYESEDTRELSYIIKSIEQVD